MYIITLTIIIIIIINILLASAGHRVQVVHHVNTCDCNNRHLLWYLDNNNSGGFPHSRN